MATTKRNDRRSGPEGSLWWFDWAGNIDDRAELEALNTGDPSDYQYTMHWYATAMGAGYQSSPAFYAGAHLHLALGVDSYNDDGTIIPGPATATINTPSFTPNYNMSHALAADGGADAIEYLMDYGYGPGTTPDPYSVHLGYWYANTSSELSSGNSETNYGAEGKVWQTFSIDITEPELRNYDVSSRETIIGVTYDEKEKQGFRNRFGALEGDSPESLINDAISFIAEEIEVTKLSAQPIFNEIVLDKGFNYNKRSFLSTEEEQQSGIASELSFVSASAPTNGGS